MKRITRDFLEHVIQPVVEQLGFDEGATYVYWGNDLACLPAEALMLGTALAESRLRNLTQDGGPALGFFQMEPATHDDIWKNFLGYRIGKLEMKIADISGFSTLPQPAERMIWDHRYAAVMCRIHYRRQPRFSEEHSLPVCLEDLAAYWKQYFNTLEGKGTVEHFLDAWENA